MMVNLDIEQRNFLLSEFFKDDNLPGWLNIAGELIDNGSCIVAGDNCPWTGGIGNFIGVSTDSSLVGCIKLTFDVKKFTTNNRFYSEVFNDHYNKLVKERDQLTKRIELIKNL